MMLSWSLLLLTQITDGVKPTLSELEKFEDQPEGIDLEVVTESGLSTTLRTSHHIHVLLHFMGSS